MARYDVFAGRVEGSYLLDVQSDLLDDFKTRVVIPLLPTTMTPPPMRKLVEINGRKLVVATHLIATVPAKELGESRLNISRHHDDIVAALDMLFQGF
ncbi:MAG: plasmid maintenance protein CcdB [Mesorhizobium sp.]|nr:MAG: plasmid maintenance protein CcdB [Mesorhizobium sp.]